MSRPPSQRLRASLALAAALLSGLRAFLWISGEAKSRDFDQVWFAARALFAGQNPYREIGPGLQFDWPAPLYYPLTAAIAVSPLSLIDRRIAAVIFAALASGTFAWASTRKSLAPAVVITSASAALAAETVQWSPLLAASYGLPWLGFVLSAKPTIGFAVFFARPTRKALIGGVALLMISLAAMPHWPQDWISALHHTSLGMEGGTPYFAPLGTVGGALSLLAVLRWRRPEARLVLALACVPQTPLLYETVPLFLVPATMTEGGLLWLGSWVAALWLSALGPYANDASRFAVSVTSLGWCLYVPCTAMILRRPNAGSLSPRLAEWVQRSALPTWLKGTDL